MAQIKFSPNKVMEAMLPTPATAVDGSVYITEKANFYVVESTNKTLVKITDLVPCNALPTEPVLNKLYLLSTNKSINLWDGVSWQSYGAVNFTLKAPTDTALGGVKSGGNGILIDAAGLISIKSGLGLKIDGSGFLIADEANIDVTKLKNYSMIPLASPMGFIDATTTLATFTNAKKGNYWICSAVSGVTLGGVTLACNDQLHCKTEVIGAPTELSTNFVKVPYTLVQATTTLAGAVKWGTATPTMNSTTASVGTSLGASRDDHVHLSDTKKMDKLSTTTVNALPVFNNTTGDLRDSTKTLPTGTLVGTTDVQTLTNKTLSDSTTIINNVTDTTKGVKLDTSGNTTGVVGTLKSKFTSPKIVELPDLNGTLSIEPTTVELKTAGNLNLSERTIYEVTSTSVQGSVYTLPTTASKTGVYIDFLIACGGFSTTVKFIIRGSNINGGSNDVEVDKSFTYFRFVYCATLSEWILVNPSNGY